jgi:hypothetical protein
MDPIPRVQIQDTLTPYVASLLEGMPKVAKLPLFAYGSKGALGFYQLQLKDLMSVRAGVLCGAPPVGLSLFLAGGGGA